MLSSFGRIFLYATLAGLSGAGSVYSGDYSNSAAGTSSGKFLTFGASARAAAMGEAYCAAAQDADAIRYNPAALSRVEGNSAQLMHANYLADTYLDHIAFARRMSPVHAIGLSALQMTYGSIPETDETGYQIGTAHPSNLAITGAYSYTVESSNEILDGGALGLSVSYIRSRIVSSAKTFTGAIGILSPAYGRHNTRLGLSAENLAGSIKYDQNSDPLPMSFKLGAVTSIQPDWNLTIDIVGPKDNSPYAALGTEKWIKANADTALAIRAGYNMLKAKDLQGMAGFAAGVGISFQNILLDYALIPFGELGYTHRLMLTFNFGKAGHAKAPPARRREYPAPVSEQEELPLEPEASPAEETPLPALAASPADQKTYQDYMESADNYISQGDPKKALREYSKAAKLLPPGDKRQVFTFEQQGQLSLKLKDVSKAKEFFLAAILTAKKLNLQNSNFINAYLGLAYCFEKSGNAALAIRNYEKAMTLTTNDKTKARIKKNIQRLKARQ